MDHDAALRAREAADRIGGRDVLVALRAVADPIRLRLLAAAVTQPDLCACDLAWVVDRQKSLVSHHLKQLRDAQLLTQRRDGRLVRFAATAAGAALVEAAENHLEVVA